MAAGYTVNITQHTEKQAVLRSLKGWVQNTSRGTVVGVLQGDHDAVDSM